MLLPRFIIKEMMHFEMGCLMNLSDTVTVVKGVGMRMKEKLERLGIKTVEDLISYYPRRYEDWTRITPMADLSYEMETAVYGTVVEIREAHPRRNLSILTVTLVDGTGAVNLVYFNQPWKKEQFAHGSNILAYGKIEYNYRKWQISNADTEAVTAEELHAFKKLVPVYPLTEGIRASQMRAMIRFAIDHAEGIRENLPADVLVREHLMGRMAAIRGMHDPAGWEEQRAARRRTAFEELFFMQAGIQLLRKRRETDNVGIKCMPSGNLVHEVMKKFPFALTEGQKSVFRDIEDSMEGIVPMQRLVQGDVGSGKTAIAILALTKIVENGIQADGIVFMKILYITGNDEMPFYSVDGMIPFSHIIEANGINEDSIFFLQADLEQLSTSMIDSNEIEVKAVISLNVLVLQCENRMIISKVEERPLDMEKIQAMPGITVYVVKNGDSMWDIAKRFYTTVEEICELNELEEDRVVPGMPLLLVKKVEG